MCRRISLFLLTLALFFAVATPAEARQSAGTTALRVYLDCQGASCDQTFLRQEVLWIDWVRDRADADVQVLVTAQRTGGGGQAYTLDFIGLGTFEDVEDRLEFATSGDATSDERRRELMQYLTLGFARYVARTPSAPELRIGMQSMGGGPGGPRGPGGPGGPQVANPENDPWNFWVFNLSANAFSFGSSALKDTNVFGSLSASRTTALWKFSWSANLSESTTEYDLGDEIVTSTRDSWSSSALLVRSIGGNWALGARGRVGANTYSNYDLYWTVEPGVEYNFFPYAESSRRSLTAQYTVALNRYEYVEKTIFDVTDETRWQHAAALNLSLSQPWGSSRVSLTGAQYLHDTDLYNVQLSGNVQVRLFRGFSVNFGGSYSWIRDQLSIEAGGLTDEQILTRQRQQATSYSYNFSFGVSYRFGSIFNNIVNPRFGGGGGGGTVIVF